MDCLLPYQSDVYFRGSLAEPMSCIVGTFHAMYHTKAGRYVHDMGIVEGGNMALLAGIGPMGLGAIDYALHCDRRPSVLVVTSTSDEKLQRAERIYTKEHAREMGVELHYVNTKTATDPVKALRTITNGKGYDDVICFAPARQIIEMGDAILGFDGCLNIFAGPADSQLKAEMNMFNVHYSYTHLVGTSGGNTEDMREAIEMMDSGKIDPTAMITHIGGLDCVVDTTLNLPNIPGGKKLVYNHIRMPLTAISDFAELGKQDEMFAELANICDRHNGLWNGEAERYLLARAKPIE
jgi:threonine dehydrogenase-like Zn-dependent dehydrogenase